MLKTFLEILMKFVEKCGEPLYTFLSIFLCKFCTIFTSVFGKTSDEWWKKYAMIGIDIHIDTRESIDTYRYFPISISINTFPITMQYRRVVGLRYFLCTVYTSNASVARFWN